MEKKKKYFMDCHLAGRMYHDADEVWNVSSAKALMSGSTPPPSGLFLLLSCEMLADTDLTF